MGPFVTFALLIQLHQLLTRVEYIGSATVDCNINSVIVEDLETRYSTVNLLVENSFCKNFIQRDTENAMKRMCMGMNVSDTYASDRQNALSARIDAMERKVDTLIQMTINVIGRCPVGYDYYENDGFCYKYNSLCRTWSEARQACQQEGADLIILKDGNFNFFRNLVISKAGTCNAVWVGSTDAAVEGQWNWLNGEKISSALWQPGQPDNWANKENCADLSKITDYRLNDEDCSVKAHFLCQIV